MARNVQLQILRGIAANLPALNSGEMYFATDTGVLYIGPTPTQIKGVTTLQAIVNFDMFEPTEDTTARVTVNAPWVTTNSELLCSVIEGQNHTDDEIAAEQITCTIGNIQSGISFDVVLSAPNGASGNFLVNILGA